MVTRGTGRGARRPDPHELRHTVASLAVAEGANVKAVQRMLGHASTAMTLDVYADLFEDDLAKVADRLDRAARRTGGDYVRTDHPRPSYHAVSRTGRKRAGPAKKSVWTGCGTTRTAYLQLRDL
jgi:hypothetical protein